MTLNAARSLEDNLVRLKTDDKEHDLCLEVPSVSAFHSAIRSAILSEEVDQDSIIRKLSRIVTCIRPLKASDFDPQTLNILEDLIRRKRRLAKQLHIISSILNLLFLLGMGITYFAIGEWSLGIGFFGSCIVIVKNLYFLFTLWSHRHRVSPILFFVVGVIAFVCIGVLVGFEITKKIVKGSEEFSILSSSLTTMKEQIEKALHGVTSLQNITKLNSHEVHEKINETMSAAKTTLKMNDVITASVKELGETFGIKKRICDLINQISVVVFPFIEFIFGVRIAY